MAAYGGPPPNTPVSPETPGYYTPRPQISFEVISEAFNLVKLQMGAWVGATFLCGVVLVIAYIVGISVMVGSMFITGGGRGQGNEGVGLLVQLVMQFGFGAIFTTLIMLMMGGMMRMALKQVRGETIGIGDLFSVTDVLVPLIGTAILMSVIGTVGTMMCFVPGFIAYGLMMFALPLVVDQRLGPIEAISQSFNMLKKDWLMATLFYFVASIVGSLGFFACGFGALFTYPIFFLAIVLTYRNYMTGGAPPTVPGTYPPVVPGGYMPQTGVTPVQGGYTPGVGYTPNVPGSYTPTAPTVPNPPTQGYAAGEAPAPAYGNSPTVPAPSYGNPTAPQYAPPAANPNAPTVNDDNQPTLNTQEPEPPKL